MYKWNALPYMYDTLYSGDYKTVKIATKNYYKERTTFSTRWAGKKDTNLQTFTIGSYNVHMCIIFFLQFKIEAKTIMLLLHFTQTCTWIDILNIYKMQLKMLISIVVITGTLIPGNDSRNSKHDLIGILDFYLHFSQYIHIFFPLQHYNSD